MISTKGRYALKVMVELAEHDAEEYIPLKGIAEKTEYFPEIFREHFDHSF